MPLLYALRNDLGLHGPRFGCGLGAVRRLHGARRRRGRALLRHAGRRARAGKKVITLEGLGTPREAASGAAGLHRRAGGAVRLLHQRHDHGRPRRFLATNKSPSEDADPRGARRTTCAAAARITRIVARREARGGDGLREARHEHDIMTPAATSSRPAARSSSASRSPGRRGARASAAPGRRRVALDEVDGFLAIDARRQRHGLSPARSISAPASAPRSPRSPPRSSTCRSSASRGAGDTALTPDQGPTYGSLSIQDGGMQIRQAAATARAALLEQAAERLGVPRERADGQGRRGPRAGGTPRLATPSWSAARPSR